MSAFPSLGAVENDHFRTYMYHFLIQMVFLAHMVLYEYMRVLILIDWFSCYGLLMSM